VEMIHPCELTPDLLRSKVEDLVRHEPASVPEIEIDLSGASRAVEIVFAGIAQKQALPLGASR